MGLRKPGRMHLAQTLLAIVGLTAGAAALGAPSADGTFAGRNGDLAFWIEEQYASSEEGTYTIAVHVGLVSPNGRRRRFVAYGLDPTFSPDGRTLAVAQRGRGIGLHRLDGKRVRRLTRGDDHAPAWSPSGRRVAFSRLHCVADEFGVERRCKSAGIYTIRRDGRGRRLLVKDGLEPTWSKTGKIAFVRDPDPYRLGGESSGQGGIHVVRGRGDPRQLVDRGFSPDWSPRGDRLVFVRTTFQHSGLFVINADGSGLRRLHVAGEYHQLASPAWAPDGRSIAFLDNNEAFTISPGGRNRHRLVDFPCDPCRSELTSGGASGLAWQPLP